MKLKVLLVVLAGLWFCVPVVFAEPMFSVTPTGDPSDTDEETADWPGIEDYQMDPDDIPPAAVDTEGPAWNPDSPASNTQVLNINREAYFGQLKRLGWRNYDVETATEPPSILLAGNREVVLENDRLVITGDDNAVLVANADGTDAHSLLFISGDEVIGGELVVDGRHFDLRPGSPNPANFDVTLEATEVPEWIFRDEAETLGVEIDEPEAGTETIDDVAAAGRTVIDVMVVYPSKLRDTIPQGRVGAEIQLAVQHANYSYAISGIHQRIKLVHVQEIDYEESGSITTDLKRLADGSDGHMDNVIDLWREKGADIVSLWVGSSDHPGVAYTMKAVSTRFAPCAVNVVRWPDAIKNFSFAHELGHNMGARHDIKQTRENLPYAHAHGYVAQRLVTVMAYPKGSCDYAICKRVDSFSNSDNQLGVLSSADNRLTLNKTAKTVSKFDSRHDLLGRCDL